MKRNFSAELRIGFTASDYVVNENYGSVMVCVALQGSVADGVEFHLTVSTQDQSAQGSVHVSTLPWLHMSLTLYIS